MAKLVAPMFRLFFPCEDAVLDYDEDANDVKWVLTRPLHTGVLPVGVTENFEQEEMRFYSQLIGGVGKFKLSVALSTEDGYWVKKSEAQTLDCSKFDPLTVHEFVFHMTSVFFARTGLYEFKLLANHAELPGGLAFFRVIAE